MKHLKTYENSDFKQEPISGHKKERIYLHVDDAYQVANGVNCGNNYKVIEKKETDLDVVVIIQDTQTEKYYKSAFSIYDGEIDIESDEEELVSFEEVFPVQKVITVFE